MSHSQFQSKRFILRLAWLSLWDERMTTGRINQVAFPTEKRLFLQPKQAEFEPLPLQNSLNIPLPCGKVKTWSYVSGKSTFILQILHLHQSLCSDGAKIKEMSWQQCQNHPCNGRILSKSHVTPQNLQGTPHPSTGISRKNKKCTRVLLLLLPFLALSLKNSEKPINWLLCNAKQCAICVPRSKKQPNRQVFFCFGLTLTESPEKMVQSTSDWAQNRGNVELRSRPEAGMHSWDLHVILHSRLSRHEFGVGLRHAPSPHRCKKPVLVCDIALLRV